MEVGGAESRERLLDAYLAGELDGEARRRIESWLHARPEERAAINQFVMGSAGLDARVRVPSPEEIVRGVRERVRTTTMESRSAGTSAQQDRRERLGRPEERRTPWRGAGTAPLRARFLPSGWRTLRTGPSGPQPETSSHVSRGGPSSDSRVIARRWGAGSKYLWTSSRRALVVAIGCLVVALAVIGLPSMRKTWDSRRSVSFVHTYSTASGQRATVTLDDGSTTILAPSTRLRYTVDRSGARMVDLVGEALFSVTQRAEQPFVVRTGAVVTKVLGTKFNVRRYPADRATQVAVLTGRVASGGHATPLVLSAGTVGDITDSSATLSLNDDPELIASWTQGHLVFHNAPVSTVLATLGRWYGYEFRATDTMITTGHMSVRLSTDRANEALNMVRTVLGVTMTFEGNVITLRPERGEKGASRSSRTHELSINPKPEVGR